MPWTNADGLPVLFGVEEAAERNIGEFGNIDSLRWVEIKLKAGELPAVADNSQVIEETYRIPAGAVIRSVELSRPTTAWASSGSGTLNIGFISDDGTGADVDYFVQEATVAELNAGGKDVAGWAGGGYAATPTVPLTIQKLLTWEVNTGAFQTGESTLYIFWEIPNIQDDTLVYTKP